MAARTILIEGAPTSGKSTSLRNLPPQNTVIIAPNGKRLPFAGARMKYQDVNPQTGQGNILRTTRLTDIPAHIQWCNSAPHFKYVVIEDFSHYFNARMMSKAFVANKSFEKWNIFGSDIYQALFGQLDQLRDDLTIIVIQHTQLGDDGRRVFKTAGKLLRDTIEPVSYFDYIFHTTVLKKDEGSQYVFVTNDDGMHEARTAMGCFSELYIDNDLAAAVAQIDAFESAELQRMQAEQQAVQQPTQ